MLFIAYSYAHNNDASKQSVDYSRAVRDYQRYIYGNIDRARHSIVSVNAYSFVEDDPFSKEFSNIYTDSKSKFLTLSNLGSGVIFGSNPSYVVTNYHVVKDSSKLLLVMHDGSKVPANIKGFDEGLDLAVLDFDSANAQSLPARSDAINVGESVYAIGSPYGLNQSVTSGIISAVARTNLGISSADNFIQTDAPINKGNSGGALIDSYGNLIGINTAVIGREGSSGIGFAIPVNVVMGVFSQIAK